MAKKRNGAQQGALIVIGGAEDRYEEKFILNHFFNLAGGRRAHIAIIPTASQDERTGGAYQAIFNDFGAHSVNVLPLFRHEDAEEPSAISTLKEATGIFLTGGDQNKILSVLYGTEALHAIVRAHSRGAVVAGTSAGAAALSDPMIAGGTRGSLARSGMAKLAPGLGLARTFIIDQHFHQRERLGRLIYAVILHPSLIGLGVDEDTAAIIHPNDEIEVLGRGTVTIIDGSKLKMFNPASVPDKSPMVFSNMVLHTLTHGGKFSVKTKSLILERRTQGD
jgi:cyanophycinase